MSQGIRDWALQEAGIVEPLSCWREGPSLGKAGIQAGEFGAKPAALVLERSFGRRVLVHEPELLLDEIDQAGKVPHDVHGCSCSLAHVEASEVIRRSRSDEKKAVVEAGEEAAEISVHG
jgi:hypothetical protein